MLMRLLRQRDLEPRYTRARHPKMGIKRAATGYMVLYQPPGHASRRKHELHARFTGRLLQGARDQDLCGLQSLQRGLVGPLGVLRRAASTADDRRD